MRWDEENKIERVAIYTRVSSDKQDQEGFSLDSQLERLRDYCKARQWQVATEYTDGGFTGRNIRRPAYQKMYSEQNKWDAVLVVKMDRIHRNSRNFIDMINQLRADNKGFISMNESIDTSTAMGRFVMYIISSVAQLESEQISERVIDAKIQQAKTLDSGWMGGTPPLGYRYDKKQKKIHKVQKELDLVKEIFRIYDEEHMSIRKLAEYLETTRSVVVYALANPFYTGYVRWCEYLRPTGIEPLISVELFNRVQNRKRRLNKGEPHLKPFLIPEDIGTDIIRLDPKKIKQTSQITKPRHHAPI